MRVGRHRTVRFPIVRTEVWNGENVQRIVDENTTVSCRICGDTFLINQDTAYIPPDFNDCDVPMVRCPWCNYRASIYHYYDRIVKGQKKS